MEESFSIGSEEQKVVDNLQVAVTNTSLDHAYSSVIRECRVEIRNLTLSEISRININPFTLTVRCKVCSKKVKTGPRCSRKCKSFFHLKCAAQVAVCCGSSILPYSYPWGNPCPVCGEKTNFGPKCVKCRRTFHDYCVSHFTSCCDQLLQTRRIEENGCGQCLWPVRLGVWCPQCSRRYHYNCVQGSFPCCRKISVNLNAVLCHCSTCGQRILLPAVVCTICWNLYHRKCIRINRKCCGLELGDILFSPELDIVKTKISCSSTNPSSSSSFSIPNLIKMPVPSKKIFRTVDLIPEKNLKPNVEPITCEKNANNMLVVKRKTANGTIVHSKGVIVQIVKKTCKTDLKSFKRYCTNRSNSNSKVKNDGTSGADGERVRKKPRILRKSLKSSNSNTPKNSEDTAPSEETGEINSIEHLDTPQAESAPSLLSVPAPSIISVDVKSEVLEDVEMSSLKAEVPTVIELDDSDDECKPQLPLVSSRAISECVDKDALKNFFTLLYDTVNKFPPAVQTEVKFKLFKVVSEAELQQHCRQDK